MKEYKEIQVVMLPTEENTGTVLHGTALDRILHSKQSGKSVFDFKEDEKSIKQMEAIKEKYARFFMFFNNSDECVEFWKNNPIKIVPKD